MKSKQSFYQMILKTKMINLSYEHEKKNRILVNIVIAALLPQIALLQFHLNYVVMGLGVIALSMSVHTKFNLLITICSRLEYFIWWTGLW